MASNDNDPCDELPWRRRRYFRRRSPHVPASAPAGIREADAPPTTRLQIWRRDSKLSRGNAVRRWATKQITMSREIADGRRRSDPSELRGAGLNLEMPANLSEQIFAPSISPGARLQKCEDALSRTREVQKHGSNRQKRNKNRETAVCPPRNNMNSQKSWHAQAGKIDKIVTETKKVTYSHFLQMALHATAGARRGRISQIVASAERAPYLP